MAETDGGRGQILLLMQTRSACEAVAAVIADHFPAQSIGTATRPDRILEDLRSRPDGILVLAEGAVEEGTLRFLREVYEVAPRIGVVLVGVPPDPDRAVALLEAGAHALVGMDAPLEDLLEGIRAVEGENVSVSPDVAWLLAARVRALSSILRGTELDPSLQQSHVHSILEKLGVRTRVGAAEYLRDVNELDGP